MELARRLEAMDVPKYSGLTRRSGRRAIWNGVVREDWTALAIPHSWKKPRKIFVNSMSDLFHDRVSDRFISAIWQVMRDTPRHNYQILTKRAERMLRIVSTQIHDILPNVWLGTSVENAEVVERVEHLRRAPATIRFISFEPLIGPVGSVNLSGIHFKQWGAWGRDNRRRSKKANGREYRGRTWDEMPAVFHSAAR
jgi:protein gp37